ncbi:MAG: MBOAT family O-acyltransferase [Nanoarchaeota archaeon]
MVGWESLFSGYLIFNSIQFVVFFILVLALYFSIPHKYRWFLLLIASAYFYMSFVPIYILILGFTICVDYIAGILIEKSSGRRRKMFLVASILSNVGVLAVFKYYNFLNENLSFLMQPLGIETNIPYLSILLPIGLSFHTFQAMSYTIEVYRKNQAAERHFGIFSLYVLFFPQLVAGPIERPQNLLHQFREKHSFDAERTWSGLRLMLWGFFKKVVIADRVAVLVDTVYASPSAYQGAPLILATLFFAVQIYCDFSGYTDIAIGSARIMGFKLMENFRRPYYARSIAEFWKRWHISLSSWFRDYVYIPLGGNRVAVPRWYLNLFVVFLVSGLWHGASWTFVIWGGLHGAYLVIGLMTARFRTTLKERIGLNRIAWLNATVQITITTVLASFAWIFFRATNVSDAFYVVRHLFSGLAVGFTGANLGMSIWEIIIALGAIALMEIVQLVQEREGKKEFILKLPRWIRATLYIGLILIILLFGVFERRQFIYFQF